MARRSPITESIRRAFNENLTLKIISFIAAIVLFSVVRGAENAQRSMFVDVVVILPPPESGKILISEVPDRVKLTLQGSRSLLNSIRREDLEIQVDLANTDLRYYYFDPASLDLPAGVQIVQMAPASIPLTWAERVERWVPVDPQLLGTPGPGLSVEEPVIVEPWRVLLRGPQNEVDSLAAVETEPIDTTGLERGEHIRRVRLERPPPHSSYVGEPMIEVRIEVAREFEERLVEDRQVAAIGPFRATVRPAHVDVLVRGPRTTLESLDPESVVPWVDLEDPDLVPGTFARPVLVRGLPGGVEVVRTEPAEAIVTIRSRE